MKNIQDLSYEIYDEIEGARDEIVERLNELTDFEKGMLKGQIMAYENLSEMIRKSLKHHECEYDACVCLLCGDEKGD